MQINPVRQVSFRNNFQNNGVQRMEAPQNCNEDLIVERNNKKKTLLGLGAAALLAGGVVAFKMIKNRSTKTRDLGYIADIVRDMSVALKKNIAPEDLSCVVKRNEFFSILSKLKPQDYYVSKEAVDNCLLKADLHSHTLFSDGLGTVADIMEEAAAYGDRLHAKTGEKFIFSITDHDGVEGVKEALEIIAQNPKRFENMRFVPGVELSFVHPTGFDKNTEGAEFLMHCINPYSKGLNDYIASLRSKRHRMILGTIERLNQGVGDAKFSFDEMTGHFLKPGGEEFAYNLHWRVYNYANIKHRITQLAKERGLDPEVLYQKLMSDFQPDRNIKSLDNFENWLATREVDPMIVSAPRNPAAGDICREFCFPRVLGDSAQSISENLPEDVIGLASRENGVLGFAHPGFLYRNLADPQTYIRNLVAKSNCVIKTAENYHQGYGLSVDRDHSISLDEIRSANALMKKLNLMSLGGKDNHDAGLFSDMDRFVNIRLDG